MKPTAFTIRVYGLLIYNGQVLLSRENIKGGIYTKFPGGGLEFGEGVIDCLKREFMEEVGIHLSHTEHFYTTEDYILSAFDSSPKQVLSIYYKVSTDQTRDIKTSDPANTAQLQSDQDQILYWCELPELPKELIELPIDKIVVKMLNDKK